MARLLTWLGGDADRAFVVLSLTLAASCGSGWSDDDDDDDDDVPAGRAPERTPAPGVGPARDASVEAAAADASHDADAGDVSASDAQDEPASCGAQPQCRFDQLLYPLPPEHGCIIVAVPCPFGCQADGGAHCAAPASDSPCAAGVAEGFAQRCSWRAKGLCFDEAEEACACMGCSFERCSLANPPPRLPPPLDAALDAVCEPAPAPTPTPTTTATSAPLPAPTDAGGDASASRLPPRLRLPGG